MSVISEAVVTVCDNRVARAAMLALLSMDVERRVLRVEKHEQFPIEELIFVARTCESVPTEAAKELVRALSMMPGSRSFSGEACHTGGYIGNNPWGIGFYKPAVYCQCCGYVMTGPTVHHIQIVRSDNSEWNESMKQQCEMGAQWHEGENLGITYEFV